ncbi:VIT family protein [Spongiibacter sp. KMU-158]|uniref:VIT family protein n=1 Tax=Spongiibacter pelagi TaxID=2760804 RepID=A0A927C0U7_9GAMM|nr:VIT family protein [Spongiibacter pelagi]MBD2859184.1 VIT family protein [Spongiibacter pelagi]
MYAEHEEHYIHRQGWLRAAVLGANDGIVSTASLLVGMASAHSSPQTILIAGVAGLVAGALSMAAGEFVSVSSQADIERADLAREERAHRKYPEQELAELAEIYRARGLEAGMALEVAKQLTEHDALEAHARDELGLSEANAARPLQAAFASALAFACGAIFPLLAAVFAPLEYTALAIVLVALLALLVTGSLAASAGGAQRLRAIARVTSWGALAMGLTAIAGKVVGA